MGEVGISSSLAEIATNGQDDCGPVASPSTPMKSPAATAVLLHDVREEKAVSSENRRRRSPPATSSQLNPKDRPILHPIEKDTNDIPSAVIRRPSLQMHPSTCTPTTFIGSPIKRRKRVNSITRL